MNAGNAAKGDPRLGIGDLRYALTGLTPLMVDHYSNVVAGEKQIGRGRLTVFMKSSILSEYFLGDIWGGKEPSQEKRRAYQFVYDIVAYAFRQ